MANMSTPDKLQNVKFNFQLVDPADEICCEACGAENDVYNVDSDFGPLSMPLCLDCIDFDYDPAYAD